MSAMLEALDRLRAASHVPLGGDLSSPVDVSRVLQPLAAAVAALESDIQATSRPSSSTLDAARRAWAQSGTRVEALSARQIRALCWDPDTATEPAFVSSLSRYPALPKNRRWIEGLIESYITQWRRMKDPSALEETLQRVVREFSGKSTRIAECKPAATHLFSAGAPTWLGDEIVKNRRSIDEALRNWRVESSSGLGEATANAAIIS